MYWSTPSRKRHNEKPRERFQRIASRAPPVRPVHANPLAALVANQLSPCHPRPTERGQPCLCDPAEQGRRPNLKWRTWFGCFLSLALNLVAQIVPDPSILS